jgi:hypothetical protein
MQRACRLTYPDSAHEKRIKIYRIVVHSHWLTAAVYLHQGGATIDEIALLSSPMAT